MTTVTGVSGVVSPDEPENKIAAADPPQVDAWASAVEPELQPPAAERNPTQAVAPPIEADHEGSPAEPSVESQVGALVVRVAQLTNEALDEARRQAERIVGEARAEAAQIVADAQRQADAVRVEANRQADAVRADTTARDPALRQIQSAIETLERVRYELSRGAPGNPLPTGTPDHSAAGTEPQTDAGNS